MGEVLWVFVLGGGEDGLGRCFEKNAYFDSTDERGTRDCLLSVSDWLCGDGELR